MAPPDVTFIFAEDVVEWDCYLSRQFEGSGSIIHHEQVEKMSFPLGCTKTNVFSDARVVLVILSPALVSFLDRRASECFQFTKLLKPSKTIAMVCGASQSSIAGVKNVLISYDDWRHLEAKDKDINMVRNVIEMIQERLAQSKETERINKPKFKLVPRKVHEGNGKVYVMLAKPLDSNAKVRITLQAKGAREVPVKMRNPYTLVFVIPDELIHVQNLVNVHVWCGEDLMGVSSVKCVSKLGELYSLLSSVPSPYEFMCNTLGVGSLHEVDFQLCTVFKKNLPKSGLNLLQFDNKQDKYAVSAKEEFPTLLHFAARYGLFQLASELLVCPGAQAASIMKNVRGLTPAQLANHEGHNKVAAAIDDFWSLSLQCRQVVDNVDKAVPCNQMSALNPDVKNNQADYYDIPGHPVPVLHLPANRTVGNTANERECDYMKMKGAHKENIEPFQNVFLEEHLDSMKSTSPAERTKLTMLESQAKLAEIMEAYKKGASLTEVERLQNEWKINYQVSDLEAKSTLDGLRSLYAEAQKAKLSKKHSSSFSELRQFLNSKLRRKESIESKGSSSRRNSKESNCSERLCSELDAVRPVSTLSVISNTSSSSGSSFDRLSMASAGSDSGHHSDFGEDRNHKLRDRLESRYQQQNRNLNGLGNVQKNMQTLNLNSKPPAPPPRPVKPMSRYGSLEDCEQSDVPHYSVSKKLVAPSFEEALKLPEFSLSQPGSKSSTLSNDWRSDRKISLPVSDFSCFDDPNADYDCPPPPRPSSAAAKPLPKEFWQVPPTPTSLSDPKTDYDMVPPPLPLSAPPLKQGITLFEQDQSYDIPAAMLQQFCRSNSVSSDYDFPKTTLMDNTDTQPACTCKIVSNRNNLSSVKSCCIGNKLSSLKRMDSLPSVPNFDVTLSNEKVKQNNIVNEVRVICSQYSNVFLKSPKDGGNERDSIPEEMAPPPPIIETDSPEEHYKIVGTPIPITSTYRIS